MNQIAIGANLGVAQPNVAIVNENERLIGEYMVPLIMESQYRIVCLVCGQENFYLRIDVINMFQNALEFFERVTKNPNAHISRFLDICATNISKLIRLSFSHMHWETRQENG